MKLDKESMLLYVVTDRAWLKDSTLEEQVEETILNGATFIQLREKDISHEEFVSLGRSLKKITDKYKIPFVINDNIQVAQEIGADGVHIGQSDMALENARKLLGPDAIIGVSANTVELAMQAEKNGANYIGVGAMFTTSTKKDADKVSLDTLSNIVKSVNIPVVAIGGITQDNILKLTGTGIDGVALVSAILNSENISNSTQKMLAFSKEMINNDKQYNF